MVDYISILIALLIICPIIPTWLVYAIVNRIVQHKTRALHFAVNWTTILYILATVMILNMMFERQFIGIVTCLILFVLAIIMIWQWRAKTEVLFGRAVKILWRICFLIFLSSYSILVVYGIAIKIFF